VDPKENIPPSVVDIGLTPKVIHEAHKIRNAEKSEPGPRCSPLPNVAQVRTHGGLTWSSNTLTIGR
jgi:hypothetical protein